MNTFYQNEVQSLDQKSTNVGTHYQQNNDALTASAKTLGVGLASDKKNNLVNQVHAKVNETQSAHQNNVKLSSPDHILQTKEAQMSEYNKTEPNWKYDATTGVIPGHVVDKAAHKLGADNLSERYFNGEK